MVRSKLRREGRKYAAWLEQNRGKFDGVILCLPNFGDENGAAEARSGRPTCRFSSTLIPIN